MNTIYFKTRESRYGGDLIDSNDRWSDREPAYIETDFLDASLSAPKYPFEQIDVDLDVSVGDEIFLVEARYQDGDTFGHTEGYVSLVAITKDRHEADDIVEAIWADYSRHPSPSWEDPEERPYASAAWKGYFNRLLSVNVHRFVVGGS